MRRAIYLYCVSTFVGHAFVSSVVADTFGSGANSFEIEFVTIGNPGNPPDTTDRPVTDGALSYRYRIGKYEVSEQMIDNANAQSALAATPLNITHDGRGANMPATSIRWYEAARFVNWLNTSTGHMPAYNFFTGTLGVGFDLWQPMDPGYDPANLYRNKLAKYFLPSLDEWHKAAYYDPVTGTYYDYPTGSDSVPDGINFPGDPNFEAVFFDGGSNGGPNEITNVGLLSPYGTLGQGGNVREWEETAFDRINSSAVEQRGLRGGSWGDGETLLAAWNRGVGIGPAFEGNFVGLRVASIIPEPSSLFLMVIGLAVLAGPRNRRRYPPLLRSRA